MEKHDLETSKTTPTSSRFDSSTILITMEDVMEITGYKSRESIYKRIRNGSFCQPIEVGGGRLRFVLSEVQTWVQEKINSRQIEATK